MKIEHTQAHLKDLLEDLHRVRRMPFSMMTKTMTHQTLAADLRRLYQDEEYDILACAGFIEVRPASQIGQTQIILRLPKARITGRIQMALAEVGFTSSIDGDRVVLVS